MYRKCWFASCVQGAAGGYYSLQKNPCLWCPYNPHAIWPSSAIETNIVEKSKQLKETVEAKTKGLIGESQAGNQGPGVTTALLKWVISSGWFLWSDCQRRDTWTPFTLTQVDPHTRNSQIYTFQFPEEARDKISGGQVASALLVKSPEGVDEVKDDKGKPVIRLVCWTWGFSRMWILIDLSPYTPISAPDEKGYVRLMIKEYKVDQIANSTTYPERLI